VNTNTTHKDNSGWQILGELELPTSASVDDSLSAWLTETLHPLDLPSELLNKIIISAQDAAAHAVQAEIIHKFEHVHFVVFVPSKQDEKESAWGFFRVQKIDYAKETDNDSDHAVEFYLYGEGG